MTSTIGARPFTQTERLLYTIGNVTIVPPPKKPDDWIVGLVVAILGIIYLLWMMNSTS